MKLGEISVSKDGERWRVDIRNEISSCAGFGSTVAEALKNIAGLADSTMAQQLLAWEAFSAGVDMDTRETPKDAFAEWWSKR